MFRVHQSTFQKFCVWALVLLILLNLNVQAQGKFELTKKLNCRKFIFAPRCRGVAAKRMFPSSTSYPALNQQSVDERNYLNSNHDNTVREILLNYLLSRIEGRSVFDNGVNSDSQDSDLSSYR